MSFCTWSLKGKVNCDFYIQKSIETSAWLPIFWDYLQFLLHAKYSARAWEIRDEWDLVYAYKVHSLQDRKDRSQRTGVVLPERFIGNSVYGFCLQGCGRENPHGSVGLHACLTFLDYPRENHKIIIFEICICNVVLAQTPFRVHARMNEHLAELWLEVECGIHPQFSQCPNCEKISPL